MNNRLEFGSSDNERARLQERYKLAFESTLSIFASYQADPIEIDEGVEGRQIDLVVTNDSALSRQQVARVEAQYVGGVEYENGYIDDEVITVRTVDENGELIVNYGLQHNVVADEYDLRVEKIVDDDGEITEQELPASDADVIEYLATMNAIKTDLQNPDSHL